MNKFFTKKESDTIISLLSSRDINNNKLGMNLIFTHKSYKSLCKLIVIRYPKIYIKEYQCISTKYSFENLIRIYRKRTKDDSWDIYDEREFLKLISNFIKKRTNEKRT